jgi:F0F1-type ATP synthase delta subunit
MLVLYMNILLITGDFQNLEIFLNKIDELITYLNNPVIRNEDKRDILTKLLKSQVNEETFKFLLVLSV